MSNLMRQRGSIPVSFNDLLELDTPPETNTYKPVRHEDIILNINKQVVKQLPDYEFVNSQYSINKGICRDEEGEIIYDGPAGKFFGIHNYIKKSDIEESNPVRRSIGFRNSYDKSMSVGWCFGASVLVCDNMMFTGDITTLRKHTKNVLQDLVMKLMWDLSETCENTWDTVDEDIKTMRRIDVTNNSGFGYLGQMYGNGILNSSQFTEAVRQWKNPTYKEFDDRNKWSLYNCANHALKTTKPDKIMNKHIQLHNMLTPARVSDFVNIKEGAEA